MIYVKSILVGAVTSVLSIMLFALLPAIAMGIINSSEDGAWLVDHTTIMIVAMLGFLVGFTSMFRGRLKKTSNAVLKVTPSVKVDIAGISFRVRCGSTCIRSSGMDDKLESRTKVTILTDTYRITGFIELVRGARVNGLHQRRRSFHCDHRCGSSRHRRPAGTPCTFHQFEPRSSRHRHSRRRIRALSHPARAHPARNQFFTESSEYTFAIFTGDVQNGLFKNSVKSRFNEGNYHAVGT